VRAVIQRVSSASVTVDGHVVGNIDRGLLVLLGIHASDTEGDAIWLAQKISALRIFEDSEGRMNRSVIELNTGKDSTRVVPPAARILVVSQFTLLASTRKGNRPSFNDAAKPSEAIPLYKFFLGQLELLLALPVATGTFGAMMQVALVNDGPVTLIVDSKLRE